MKRKFIDEKGRIFGVVSAVDILVVAAVLALAAAVYMRFFTNETTATTTVDDQFTYEIRLSNVRMLTIDALREGDAIYEKDNGTLIGTVESVTYEQGYKTITMADGSMVLAPVEERYDVIITVSASGLVSDGRYYASRVYELNANSDISFYTKYLGTTGTVWSVG